MDTVIVFLISLNVLSFIYAKSAISYKTKSLKVQLSNVTIEKLALEDKLKTIKMDKETKADDAIHKENFIKFISDSRDLAFEYIEEFQAGLGNFISSVEPEINYFKEYGDIMSMSPNYYSLKKIVEEYEKLKALLPEEEQQ